MIRVESIAIKEFRGVRDLTLDFREKNFAICGPNGTGKSGVVDALEFALTGNVSRLSGEGRGDVSLKQHGPHVDRRSDPEKASVTVKIFIPSLKKSVTIERNLKTPTAPKVSPSDPTILGVLAQVKAHPEIVLSRRELIRYVLATPGKRAEEVQALLHLDQVEQVRIGLQKIANACEKRLTPLGASLDSAKENLLRALGTSDLKDSAVLVAVNVQRAILGLPALPRLTGSTSLKDGLGTPVLATPQSIPKAQAIADIRAARRAVTEIKGVTTTTSIAELTADLTLLVADPALASDVRREALYASGLDLVVAEACPLCDTLWNMDDLKKHIQAKIGNLKEVSAKRQAAEQKIAPLIVTIRKIQNATKTLIGYAELVTPPLGVKAASDYIADCKNSIDKLTTLIPISEAITALKTVPTVPQAVLDTINELDKLISDLPEPTRQDASREWLTIAQERLEVWRERVRVQTAAKEQARRARQVYDIYANTSDKVLTEIYSTVEKDFASLYAFLNRDDEGKFTAQLMPSLGKLGFDVDFYGRGFFPPGAYHSEGHQDGMGLCLYLTLMRHIHGAAFTLAVLDDVLMSVDAGHRREVCKLLKEQFPDTQFILTTHDPIWLRHMRTEKIIDGRSSVQFRTWSVEQGPTRWDARDVWTEIEEYRNQNDVRAAAALLRHYLEYDSAELCHRLRAPVEFRGDAQYQLGELLPAAIRRMRDLFRRAKVAANSWDQKETVEQLATCEDEFTKLAESSKTEDWQVNVAVHYNSWDNLGKEDFAPVVDAYHKLLDGFTCSDCREYLRVSPDRETPESLRCDCGKVNFNLREKSG